MKPSKNQIIIIIVLVWGIFYTTPSQLFAQKADSVTIEYIAHSSFLLHAGDKSILVDPFADQVWIGYDFPENIEADAAVISHPHFDHDGGLFMGRKPYWFFKMPVVQNPSYYTLDPFILDGVIGKHAKYYGEEFRQMNTIWIFKVAGLTIVHLGDNQRPTEKTMNILGKVDILLAPMDEEEHILTFKEVDEIVEKLKPSITIPMHYRIDQLEPDPDRFKNFGTIDSFVKKRKNTKRLKTNKLTLTVDDLPEKHMFYVLDHSPKVQNPLEANK